MIDNLTEAIAHAKEKAKELRERADVFDGITSEADITECLECASEHEQLAVWLEELAERRESDRWNVIRTEADLPKESEYYYATMVGALGNTYTYCVFYSVSTKEFQFPEKVIAWKPMPKPYESED